MLDRGLRATVNSDDPAYFGAYVNQNLAEAQAAAGLTPVKGNAVLMRGLNDDEAVPLLRYCLERGYELRFIEQMPLDAQHGWKRAEMVTADEILAALGDDRPESVTVEVASGFPVEELLKASADADLIVLGSRGAGGFSQLLLGSVSHQVTHHAHCPVVIVPPEKRH